MLGRRKRVEEKRRECKPRCLIVSAHFSIGLFTCLSSMHFSTSYNLSTFLSFFPMYPFFLSLLSLLTPHFSSGLSSYSVPPVHLLIVPRSRHSLLLPATFIHPPPPAAKIPKVKNLFYRLEERKGKRAKPSMFAKVRRIRKTVSFLKKIIINK